MNDVLIARIISGEEIIANLSISDEIVSLKNPAVVIIQAGSNGRPSVGLADYLMLADKKEIQISLTHILCIYEPNSEVKNAYNSAFGSGIVIAKPLGNILPFSR
jgi:hypothetical protein